MKVKLNLDILCKAIFTVYFVQMLRYETENTLQMTDYHRVLPVKYNYHAFNNSISERIHAELALN
jgi:hypothetical protein